MASFTPEELFARQAMPTSAGVLTGATVPSGSQYSGVQIEMGNNSGVDRYGLLWVVPSGGARSTVTQVAPTFLLPATDFENKILELAQVIKEHHTIHAWVSGADVSIVGAGMKRVS